ncbi:MAG TPA: DUF2911 domain-containing protein [Terriglobia bacterium]|nr:DUF2911 domain-containing protein [Terriglobia bacterium]
MKRAWVAVLVVAATAVLSPTLFAQNNPRGKAAVDLNGTKVSVEYGRPSLNGRTVDALLGQLPAGGFWRLGADKSTTFSTSGDLAFGDVAVPKGDYSLWAQKQADNSWKLVFNKQHGQWGTSHDPAQDFASVPLKAEKEGSAQQVTIKLEKEHGDGEISIQWGNMELSTTFKAK